MAGWFKGNRGALIPEKSFWYMIYLEWVGGNWRYEEIKDCPG